jgi:hypothetical protein
MLKTKELSDPNSCLSKARDDEYIFVLLARDVTAPAVVREWCRLRCLHGKNTPKDAQITEALAWADRVDRIRQHDMVAATGLAHDPATCWHCKNAEITGAHK